MNKDQISVPDDEKQLVLEPQLDVARTRTLYSELDNALMARKPLAFNAIHVERVDAATLQLLAGFCHAAREAGIPIRWVGASTALRNAAAFLDLEEILGKPS